MRLANMNEAGPERVSKGLDLRPFLPAVFMTLFSAALAGAASLRVPADGMVGIVFSPGLSSEEGIRRVVAAGGLPIDVGAFDNIMVAWAESPTFQSRIEDEGAWLVVDPRGFGGCLRPLFEEDRSFGQKL